VVGHLLRIAIGIAAVPELLRQVMVSYFLGGAACSAISSAVFDADGWDGVCALGAGIAVVALLVWALTEAGRVRGTDSARRAQPAAD
jgi:hypothetical protein